MLTLTVLLSLAGPSHSAPVGDAVEVIAGLIESTDRLEHFSAVYQMQRDGQLAEFQIDYLAPGSLCWRVSSPGQAMTTTLDGDEIWMATTGYQGKGTHGAADWLDRGGPLEEAQLMLAELAPLREGVPLVFVRLDWSIDAETDKTDLSFSIGKTLYGDMHLLGWLGTLERRPGELELVDGRLIYDSERMHIVVDAGTGFLSELRAVGVEGSVMELTLQSLDLETPPGRVAFMQPKVPKGATDISAQIGGMFRSPQIVRVGGLHRFHALVEGGRRELDEQLLDDLRCFLLALHEPQMTGRFSPHLERLRAVSGEFGDGLRARLDGGAPRETVEREAAEHRLSLEKWIEQQRSERLADLPAEPGNMADSQAWMRLRAAEDEVYLSLFDEVFGEPALADHDAAVAAALGG